MKVVLLKKVKSKHGLVTSPVGARLNVTKERYDYLIENKLAKDLDGDYKKKQKVNLKELKTK